MKILKTIGIGLLGVIVLLVIISFFLPRKVHVERSIEINGNPQSAFVLINNLKNWEQWSPWHKLDPNTKWTFSETAEGTGAWYNWTSENKNVGNGKLTILESKENEHIKTQLDFEGMSPAFADYIFTPTDNGYKLTWTMDSDMGMNPIGKFFGLMMDAMIGPDYEKGLKSLKELAEAGPQKETIGGFDFEEREMPAMMVAGIAETVKMSDFSSAKFAGWFGSIGKTLETSKIKPVGPPMTIYYRYDKESTDMEAAMPVESKGKDVGTVKFHDIAATKALVVKYMGDYSKTEAVYNAAFEYMGKKGMKENGAPMEIYITDPMMEKDTAKWLTEIVFPIK